MSVNLLASSYLMLCEIYRTYNWERKMDVKQERQKIKLETMNIRWNLEM